MNSHVLLFLLTLTVNYSLGSPPGALRVFQADLPTPEDKAAIAKLRDSLYFNESETWESARRELLRLAKKSASLRSQVIEALLQVLRDPRTRQPGGTRAWYSAASLLGELKAIEAVPILVANLDFNDGTIGLSLAHFPAAQAVTKIGKPAVPHLSKALFNSNRLIRQNAARALGEIDDKRAVEPLTEALKTESDPQVRHHIQSALSRLTDMSKP